MVMVALTERQRSRDLKLAMAEADPARKLGQFLLDACQDNKEEEAIRLIEKDAQVNVTDEDGWSPLYWAAYRGSIKLAELLLQKGAQVNATDDRGYGPLHFVASWGNVNMAEILLQKGADADAKDRWGVTPLMEACERHSPLQDIAKWWNSTYIMQSREWPSMQ